MQRASSLGSKAEQVSTPSNNKMQRTSRGSNGGSPLILVFYAPRQGRARDTYRLDSEPLRLAPTVPQTDAGFAPHALGSL